MNYPMNGCSVARKHQLYNNPHCFDMITKNALQKNGNLREKSYALSCRQLADLHKENASKDSAVQVSLNLPNNKS